MRLVKGLLQRCLEVVELLAANRQWSRLSDIAGTLNLEKGPAHRLLTEMTSLGWVEQDAATDRYRLTLKLALLGQQYLHGTGLSDLVQPVIDEVAKRSRELVRLTVVHGNALHWLASAQGSAPGLMYQPSMSGRPIPHITANGKAWLATMSDEAATRLALQNDIARTPGLSSHYGPRALSSVADLLRELGATRERGYGLSIEEAEPGVKAMAVVVRSFDGQRVVGTMSIAGPLLRIGPERDEEFYKLLHQAAGTLSLVWPRDDITIADTATKKNQEANR